MQCGICRIPFKLEYFGNDAQLIQIFKNKLQENRRNIFNNNNNEIINLRLSQSHRSIVQTYNINSRYNNRPNDRDLQLQILSYNTNNFFIILFHPNKFICISILIINLLIAGLGTLILGVKNLNLYDFFLSLMQLCFCYPFISKGIDIKKKRTYNNKEVNSFLWIYLFFIASIFYLSSIYSGIFHNFIFLNPRKIKNKEKACFVLILNIIIGGLGTIFYGIIEDGIDCCKRIKIWIVGIPQVFAFILWIVTISTFNNIKIGVFIGLFIIGFFAYVSSVATGIIFYRKMVSSSSSSQ